jgi:hypothetical protein
MRTWRGFSFESEIADALMAAARNDAFKSRSSHQKNCGDGVGGDDTAGGYVGGGDPIGYGVHSSQSGREMVQWVLEQGDTEFKNFFNSQSLEYQSISSIDTYSCFNSTPDLKPYNLGAYLV